ncbi:hypothetical protein B0I08_102368 [Glaciihabitans tibetensis]|uniref:HIRAN domain-containing protein n=1 Tax=Glaciihabitans tibetensis TaxID=1266600 RepID=A0A2T0VHP8_9MICO|nr:hypothetical protein [Glaciihabitans tibetensis]PRY69691.1 hypothetical protein B0I08_102368 [Glaciihabitans tibetensis]
MRNIFARQPASSDYPKTDSGSGQLKDYGYDLIPLKKGAVIQLAGSQPHSEVLAGLVSNDTVQAFVAGRTPEEERTDAPMPVRFFVDSRMTPVVGFVPRGLEPVVLEALVRLEKAGRSTRIPATVVSTKNGLRVNLLMGATR